MTTIKGLWTHVMCAACWDSRFPGHPAEGVSGLTHEVCCFCLEQTGAGIYVRWNPASEELKCKLFALHEGQQ